MDAFSMWLNRQRDMVSRWREFQEHKKPNQIIGETTLYVLKHNSMAVTFLFSFFSPFIQAFF